VALPAVRPQSDVRVAFDSFANIHYGKMRSLYGWQTTRNAVEATLRQWYVDVQTRQTLTDGTPAQLQTFLEHLPTEKDCAVSVVYLGSIQTADGRWRFVNGHYASWSELLAADIPPHPCRIVILDACSAAVVRQIPAWRKLATLTLLASEQGELTYDFFPSRLHPVDVQQRLPLAYAWGQTHLDAGWDKHISFLGLIWMQSAAMTDAPPADLSEWRRFFDLCGQNAADFARQSGRRWASTLNVYLP